MSSDFVLSGSLQQVISLAPRRKIFGFFSQLFCFRCEALFQRGRMFHSTSLHLNFPSRACSCRFDRKPTSVGKVQLIGDSKETAEDASILLNAYKANGLERHSKRCAAGRRPMLIPVPFAAWHVAGWVSEPFPRPPITRNQVELMQIDIVASAGMPRFYELEIPPRSVEQIMPTTLPWMEIASSAT